MHQKHFPLIQLILDKLQEDLVLFKIQVDNSFIREGNVKNTLSYSLNILTDIVQILELLGKTEPDKIYQKNVLNLCYEALKTVYSFYKELENYYPLFLDTVTVFFEPLIDKLEQLVKTFKKGNINTLDLEELSYVVSEIVETLEIAFANLEKLDKNPYN